MICRGLSFRQNNGFCREIDHDFYMFNHLIYDIKTVVVFAIGWAFLAGGILSCEYGNSLGNDKGYFEIIKQLSLVKWVHFNQRNNVHCYKEAQWR